MRRNIDRQKMRRYQCVRRVSPAKRVSLVAVKAVPGEAYVVRRMTQPMSTHSKRDT